MQVLLLVFTAAHGMTRPNFFLVQSLRGPVSQIACHCTRPCSLMSVGDSLMAPQRDCKLAGATPVHAVALKLVMPHSEVACEA